MAALSPDANGLEIDVGIKTPSTYIFCDRLISTVNVVSSDRKGHLLCIQMPRAHEDDRLLFLCHLPLVALNNGSNIEFSSSSASQASIYRYRIRILYIPHLLVLTVFLNLHLIHHSTTCQVNV